MRLLKILLIPAALAMAPWPSAAAPGNALPLPAAAQESRDANITAVRHNWRHYWRQERREARREARRDWRRYNRWQRHDDRRYRYYYHSPRCYWSNRWQRRICR
jgi:hypothetical protein